MTTTTTTKTRSHWLESIAADGGYDTTGTSQIDPAAPVLERWALLCQTNGVSERDLARIVAGHFRIPVANLARADIRAMRLVPEKVASRFGIFPLREDTRTITVATSDPGNLEMEEAVRFASGRQPHFEVAPPREILTAVQETYTPSHAIESLLDGLDATRGDGVVRVVDPNGPEAVDHHDVESAPVVKLTNLILRQAARERASDIHLEPGPVGGVVRFRVDGVLRPHMKLPSQALSRVVSRIKIIAKLDITDRLRPQDGRTRLQVDDQVYDMRVSTVPTRESEKAVVRLLDPQATRNLDDLELPELERDRIRQLLGNRHGIVLVTGPTGSGKTTSIYAMITELSSGEINIMSVEDPVEYDLPGVTQIQVEPKQKVTFASALKAILRQDPDVIFVGEIRDRETAEVAVQASMTGHLVLATLHTNDATGVIPRLLDIGLDAASIAATLRGAVAQRLLRRVCTHCAVSIAEGGDDEEKRLAQVYGVTSGVCATGCNHCGHSGYRGRVATAEVLVSNPKLQEQILSGAGTAQLERVAIEAGMRRMLDTALEKAAAGETSLSEVERVLGEAREEQSTVPSTSHALIVDDDPLNRMVVKNMLLKNGFETTEAVDGLDALDQLRKPLEIALIVLDLDMPRMTGAELLTRLRESPATAGIPVIVLTGSEDQEAEARLIDQGADDYIEKPVDQARFLARVRATLRRCST